MKILVATALTQGNASNDYHYCVEGELVWIQEPCDRDRKNPDGPCGCGRGFAGAASHKATTTAAVVESEMTREEVADENLGIAADLPVGTVIGRRLDEFLLRAVRLGG
jgi:hypothetical protein